MDVPASGEVEVCLLGPGFGESLVIHLGDGRWMIVDSCLDRTTRRAAALTYLELIGVDASAVELIVVTHWHDDHIRGMAEVVKACGNARVCLPAAFRTYEFQKFVSAYSTARNSFVSSGVDEISRSLNAIRESGRAAVPALASKRLLFRSAPPATNEVEVWSLSPSDAQFALAMAYIAKEMPGVLQPKTRAAEPAQNDLSVAVWIRVGDAAILLGSDLEEAGKPDLGWSAVLKDPGRPRGKAVLFKIPHHGSVNGHHAGVWAEMLASKPTAILTPYNKGRGLPTEPDVDRLLYHAPDTFSTAKLKTNKFRRPRSRAVERTISEVTKSLTATLSSVGRVRSRFTPPDTTIAVLLSEPACHLSEFIE